MSASPYIRALNRLKLCTMERSKKEKNILKLLSTTENGLLLTNTTRLYSLVGQALYLI